MTYIGSNSKHWNEHLLEKQQIPASKLRRSHEVMRQLDYFKDYNNCILVFIRDSNLKSISSTLRDFKSNRKNKTGTDKLIRNYGIGAQIIKALRVKNMILVTRSPKKVIGLEGFGIKITKQEIIK